MPSSRFAARRAIFGAKPLLALTIAILPFDLGHAQGRLEAYYTASIAGLPIGKGAWIVEIGDDQYTTAASGSVTGLLRAFGAGEGSAAAHGTVSAGRPLPTSYAIHVSADEVTDEVQMTLSGGTVKELVAEPPFAPAPDRVPVTEAHRRGVTDPMSAGLIPVAGTGDVLAPQACERILPVFDGRQRFDLALSFKRMDKVKAEKGYEGPVVVCTVTYQPLAGHRASRYAIKYLMATRGMEMWLAPLAGTRIVVPFRIAIPTLIGAAVLEATQFVTVAQAPRPQPATHAKTQ